MSENMLVSMNSHSAAVVKVWGRKGDDQVGSGEGMKYGVIISQSLMNLLYQLVVPHPL